MSESALLLPIPEAEEVVDSHRLAHDPGAEWGVPAHVTVLYPFFEPDEITTERVEELRDLFGGIDPFEFTFRETGTFPGILYLCPEPREVFEDLTRLVSARYPDRQPYGGAFDEIIPHLTVAHEVDDETMAAIEAELSSGLPIRGEAREVQLIVGGNGPPGWEFRHRFPLGKPRPPPTA